MITKLANGSYHVAVPGGSAIGTRDEIAEFLVDIARTPAELATERLFEGGGPGSVY